MRDELVQPLWPQDRAEIALDGLIEKAAVGELVVTAWRARLTGSDPPSWLFLSLMRHRHAWVLTRRQDVPAATRDAFVRTAESVAAGLCSSQPKAPSRVAPQTTTSLKPVM